MIGTPQPKDVHFEDTAFYHSVQIAFGTRQTAERSSLTAVGSVGGLQLPRVVEAVASGVANEVLYLLNGNTTASKIARHALKESMYEKPNEVDTTFGLVNRALTFLAGYASTSAHQRIDLLEECYMPMQKYRE